VDRATGFRILGPRLLQHVEFAIGFAQFAGEVEGELFEELDFEGGMGRAESLEIFQAQGMAIDIGFGDDVGGTRRTIDKGHFSERHAGRKGGETLAVFAGQEDVHEAAREEVNFARIVAGGDDLIAALEGVVF